MDIRSNFSNIAKELSQDYRGEWRPGVSYRKNDVVRMNGAAYVCKTDKYFENNLYGERYKPEHDSEGWDRYSSGYCWTGQWMENGEYYPGDIINYNGDRYVCKKHGKFIHPVYEGTSSSSYWDRISANSNQNKANRCIMFWNREPMGWNDKNWGSIPGRIDNGYTGGGRNGMSFINGNYEAVHVGYLNSYSFGASEFGYSGQQDKESSSVFQRWDEYDGYRTSTVDPGIFGSRGRIIQGIGDGVHMFGYLFDTGEVYWSGWMGSGEHGDGGTSNRYYTRRVGRCNNDGGGFDYNQQIQQYQGSFGNRRQGLIRDIQAIKLGTSCSTYAQNSSTTNGALDIDGQIWTWGYNGHSGLGRNFRYNNSWYNSYVPSKIPQQYFDNRKLVDFWMGGGNYQYTLAKDEDGNLWGWGYNYNSDHLGVGNDEYTGSPRKVPYNWEKHGGIKKVATAGYNTYYITIVLTHDGVLHMAGQGNYIGRNFYNSGDYNDDTANIGNGFSPMQKYWWDRARALDISGAGLRNLWNVTDLYNDVEDFWLSNDQNNERLFIKQKSTGMIYGVGAQAYYRFGTHDWLVGENQDTGDNPYTNPYLQYPVPVYVGYSDIIDIQRSGSGNNEWRKGAFLSATGRLMTIGSGDIEGAGRGHSANSGYYAVDGRNKLPWEFNATSVDGGGNVQMHWFSKIACIQGGIGNDGFFALCQDDKVYYTGDGSGLDPSRGNPFSYSLGRFGL